LLSALQGSFSSTYLTLTSIIQGVTLGYLVVVVDDEKGRFEPAHWLLVATTFLIIVAAWHEYMMAVTVLTIAILAVLPSAALVVLAAIAIEVVRLVWLSTRDAGAARVRTDFRRDFSGVPPSPPLFINLVAQPF